MNLIVPDFVFSALRRLFVSAFKSPFYGFNSGPKFDWKCLLAHMKQVDDNVNKFVHAKIRRLAQRKANENEDGNTWQQLTN